MNDAQIITDPQESAIINPFTDVGAMVATPLPPQINQFLDLVRQFRAGAGNRAIYISEQEGLWAGAEKFADAPFSVSLAGIVKGVGQWKPFSGTRGSDGSQSITGIGFKPKVVIAFAYKGSIHSHGFATGTGTGNQKSMTDREGVGGFFASQVIYITDAGDTNRSSADPDRDWETGEIYLDVPGSESERMD